MWQQKRGHIPPRREQREGPQDVKRHAALLEAKPSLQACRCEPYSDQDDDEKIWTDSYCKTAADIDDRSRLECRYDDSPGNQRFWTKVKYKQAYRYDDQADRCYGHDSNGRPPNLTGSQL